VVIREQEMEAQREPERELREAGVTIYRTYPEMLERERARLDLVTVPAGIDQHAPLSIAALGAGFDVLCEKPAAGSLDEALRMKKARDGARRTLAIGFQHLSAPSIQKIKRLMLERRLGGLVRARGYAAWPRTSLYYGRNYWSGKIRVNGKTIYDSPIQNAVSHYFNNLLYLAGASADESATPREVYGENLRANSSIESPDTQFIRVRTEAGARLEFFATHATATLVNPVLELTCEAGRVVWEQEGRTRVYRGGSLEEEFGDDGVVSRDEMFRGVLAGKAVSTIDNAWQHVACVEALFESSPVAQIPDRYVETRETREPAGPAVQTVIAGIDEVLGRMFREGGSFAEIGAPWALPGRVVTLS
jgi:predicted dehydrogenase